MKAFLLTVFLLLPTLSYSSEVCRVKKGEETKAVCTDRNDSQVYKYGGGLLSKDRYLRNYDKEDQLEVEAIKDLIDKGYEYIGSNTFVKH